MGIRPYLNGIGKNEELRGPKNDRNSNDGVDYFSFFGKDFRIE